MNGWISLHRKILDNPIVCKDSETFAVWNYLLLNATHKEIQTLFEGKKVTLSAGQLIIGRKSIAQKLKIDEFKVHRILKTFEKSGQIEQKMGNRNRLITVLNWNLYQNNKYEYTPEKLNETKNNTDSLNKEIIKTEEILNQENEKDELEKKLFSKNRSIEYLELEAEYFEKTRAVPFARKIRLIAECKKTEKYKKLSDDEKYDLYVALIV